MLDIDVLNGQKTGYFLDQKNNRKALQSYARDLTVLDCFCNQGGFALNCGLGGAKKVIGIDASSEAIARASHNAEINNLSNTVSFEVQDVFEYLPELNRQNQKFDMIILDPPAFTKSRSSLKNALNCVISSDDSAFPVSISSFTAINLTPFSIKYSSK